MLAVAGAEIALAKWLVTGAIPLWAWLALHTALVGLLAWGYWQTASRGGGSGPRTVMPLFLVATAALGPVGSGGALLTAALVRLGASSVTRFDLWYPAAVAEAPAKSRALTRQLSGHQDAEADGSGVSSFSDVLSGGSVEQKQAVITLIASRFKPGFAPALLSALHDDDPAVRVLAASATGRIENDFLTLSMNLEARHQKQPSDFELTWKLARHYDEFANSGMLDDARTISARLRALDLYRECEHLRPSAADVLHARIRLLVRLGRDDEAVAALAPLVAGGNAPEATLTWYVECLFKKQDYDALRDTCRFLQNQPGAFAQLSERCRDTVSLWAAPAHAS
jgi:hypothetical protein